MHIICYKILEFHFSHIVVKYIALHMYTEWLKCAFFVVVVVLLLEACEYLCILHMKHMHSIRYDTERFCACLKNTTCLGYIRQLNIANLYMDSLRIREYMQFFASQFQNRFH